MEVAKDDATRAALQGLPAPAPPPRISPEEAAALRQQRIEAQQRRNQPSAVTLTQPPVDSTVPADLAHLLRELSLSAHGTNLVDKLGVTSVADLKYITDDMISKELPTMKPIERAKLLAATKTGGSAHTVVPSPAAAPAPASRLRVRALVIGIDGYSSPVPGKLGNAISDATAIHEALCKLPGAHSTLLTDCSKSTFEAALKDFRDGTGTCYGRGMRVTAAPKGHDETTLALFFFAGHGIQVSGRNYLVPADFAMPHRSDKLEPMLRDTERACVSLGLIEEYMEEAEVTAAALWLDCCRNVPDFLADLGAKRSAGGTRALPAGMGTAAPGLPNLMISFAAAPGKEALDRSSRVPSHSPFTAALLRVLSAPRRLIDVAPFLTDEVVADTGGKQQPHVGGSYGVSAGNLVIGA
jgi:Caspase domain